MLSVVKPLQEFGKLDKCLSRYGTRFEFNNEKQVIFSSDVNSEDTFVILEGVISLRREENVLIGITQAPYIMGLADGLMKNDIPYKLISEGNCTGYHLPAKQTITLIEQNQLWRSVVAEVLAALRKGGYIEMNKGKLVAINRLPSEY